MTFDRTSDQLQIEFRSAATSFQPAWLRIEFRSTQAVTPLKSSLPVLVNDEYPTVGNWILDSDAVPFATNGPMKVVTDIAAELQNEFAWTMLDISEPEELQKMWVLRKVLHPMDELAAVEFLLNKLQDTKTNVDFFEAMKR